MREDTDFTTLVSVNHLHLIEGEVCDLEALLCVAGHFDAKE